MDVRNKVLVCGEDNLTTLGIIRELGAHNISFILLSMGTSSIVSKSHYCHEIINVDNIDNCFSYLQNNFNQEKYKPIIIISSDRLAYLLDNFQEKLSSKYILPCSGKPGTLKYYTDKYNMQVLAEKIGINCLASKRITKESSIENIEYPCFLKPCIEKPGYYNEFKYKICKNHKSLKKALQLVRQESNFVVQRLLNKTSELVVYGCRMKDGNTIIAGAMIQDRFADSGFASHGKIIKEIPKYIDVQKIKEFIERVDFYGPFDFEFGIEGDKAYYMETNFRCVGPTGFFDKSGASLIAAYVYSCAGLDYNIIPHEVVQENWCIDDLYDIENVLTFKMSTRAWKESYRLATLKRFYDKDDINPYLAEKKRRWKKIIRDIILKRIRLYIVFIGDRVGLRK